MNKENLTLLRNFLQDGEVAIGLAMNSIRSRNGRAITTSPYDMDGHRGHDGGDCGSTLSWGPLIPGLEARRGEDWGGYENRIFGSIPPDHYKDLFLAGDKKEALAALDRLLIRVAAFNYMHETALSSKHQLPGKVDQLPGETVPIGKDLHFDNLDELMQFARQTRAWSGWTYDIAAACGTLEAFFAHESAPYWCYWLAYSANRLFPQGEKAISDKWGTEQYEIFCKRLTRGDFEHAQRD